MEDKFDVKIFSKESQIAASSSNSLNLMGKYLDFYVGNPIEPIPEDSFNSLKTLIAFSAAYSVFMPDDGFFALTVSVPSRKRRFFSSVDIQAKSFVARSHFYEPASYEKTPRLNFQKISNSQNLNALSFVDCPEDVPNDSIMTELFERYVANSEEKIRFFWDGDIFTIRSLFFEAALESFESVGIDLNFCCGCNREKIASIFSGISKEHLNFLFKEGDSVTVECPRCGLKYDFKREELEKKR